jgi:hypothetical protein
MLLGATRRLLHASVDMMEQHWLSFAKKDQLSLAFTLTNGQCFGWRREGETFTGVLGQRVLSFRESQGEVQVYDHTAHGEQAAAAGAGAIEGTAASAGAEGGSSSSAPALLPHVPTCPISTDCLWL